MILHSRPMTNVFVLSQATPIADMLESFIGPETLATWNTERRRAGGEWDTLRAVPLVTRKRLTTAGYLSLRGMLPDVFADLLVSRGAPVGPDPIAWYVRTALRALEERQTARRRAREQALSRSTANRTLFHHRDQLAKAAGFKSYYDYRMKSGWGDGHGRGVD